LDAAMALEDRQQALVASSADAREAINAFLEKRTPSWKNQ
jgi:enoyl-CoA hydratase/carnithine racemase